MVDSAVSVCFHWVSPWSFSQLSPPAAAQTGSFRLWQWRETEVNGSQPEQGTAGKPPSTSGMLLVLTVYTGSEGNWKNSQKEMHLGSLTAENPPQQQTPETQTSWEINLGNHLPLLPVHPQAPTAASCRRAYPWSKPMCFS